MAEKGEWHAPWEEKPKANNWIGLGIFGAIVAAIIGAFVVIVGIVAIFFFAIIGALMGAITGYILHLVPVLGPLVENGLVQLGIKNPDLTSIGAAIGFIAGFFKSAHEHK